MEKEEREFSLPDHTRIQVVAIVQAIIAVAVAFGVPVSNQQSVALVALAGVIGTMLIGADAAIRRERARNADKLRPRATVSQTTGPEGTQTTATLNVPLGPDGGDGARVEDLDEQVLALLRRILEVRDVERPAEPEPRRRRSPSGKGSRTARSGPS